MQKTDRSLQEERQASSRLQGRIQQLEAEGAASLSQLRERDATIASLVAEKQGLQHTAQQLSDLESSMSCSVHMECISLSV